MCLYMDDNEGGTISVLGRVVSVDLGKTDPDDDSNSVTEISPHEPYITVALPLIKYSVLTALLISLWTSLLMLKRMYLVLQVYPFEFIMVT